MTGPRLRIFAGPNGSGKNTITDKIASINSAWLGVYVNPDEIEKEISPKNYVDLAKYKIENTETEIISALRRAPQLIDKKLISNLGSIKFNGSIHRFKGI